MNLVFVVPKVNVVIQAYPVNLGLLVIWVPKVPLEKRVIVARWELVVKVLWDRWVLPVLKVMVLMACLAGQAIEVIPDGQVYIL